MVATDIRVEASISRPRDEVAGFVMAPENDPAWLGGVVEAHMITDGPFGVGAKVRRVAKFLGRSMSYETEVVEYEAGRRIVMTSSTPFPLRVSYHFDEAQGGTLLRARLQGEAGGFYRLAARC